MKSTNNLRGLIQLVRPELPFAAGVCVVIGEIVALGRFPSLSKLLLGFMWGFFLSCPAMILNDYFDIEVDKINAPNRPLPSGIVSPAVGIYFACIITLMGLTVSYIIGLSAVVIYISFWFIGFLYNWKLKEKGLLGNLLVSSSVAITLIFGSIVVGQPCNKVVWIISLIAFFFNLGEEIAADALDIEGDKQRNGKSIAILLGKKNAFRISAALFVLMAVLSYLPYYWSLLGLDYLIIVSCLNMLITYFGIRLFESQTIAAGRVYIRRMYLSTLAGMLAIIIISCI